MLNKFKYIGYRLKYRFAKELKLDRPVDISLELAAACQLGCVFCYWHKPKEIPFKPGMMTWETAQLILADAASIGVNSIKLNYRGESTLNPIFSKAALFAKEHAIGSTFIDRVTNSNFMFSPDREDIFEGLCAQTKVKVSFDSFIPEVLHKQRVKSDYSRIIKNIDIFYNHAKRKNTELVIQSVITNLNKDEDIYGEAKRRWPEAQVSVRNMVEGRVTADLSGLENRKRDFTKRQSCIQATARLIFDWQGIAQVCCPDIKSQLQFGNIKDTSIFDIWNDPKVKKLRADLLSKKAFELEPCKSCSSYESFKGYKHPWGS